MNPEEAKSISLRWKLAREENCEDCAFARGCKEPCQLLRNYVKNGSLVGVSVKREDIA